MKSNEETRHHVKETAKKVMNAKKSMAAAIENVGSVA
jgi:hypothetical protein